MTRLKTYQAALWGELCFDYDIIKTYFFISFVLSELDEPIFSNKSARMQLFQFQVTVKFHKIIVSLNISCSNSIVMVRVHVTCVTVLFELSLSLLLVFSSSLLDFRSTSRIYPSSMYINTWFIGPTVYRCIQTALAWEVVPAYFLFVGVRHHLFNKQRVDIHGFELGTYTKLHTSHWSTLCVLFELCGI